MLVFMKCQSSLKLGHVGYKTRSLGQIIEKPYIRSRGHIFMPIIMKLFGLLKYGKSLKMGHVMSKTVTRSIFEKHCVRSRCYTLSLIIMKLGHVFLDEMLDKILNEYVG